MDKNTAVEIPQHPKADGSAAMPLCVDLDGTLVQTDTLFEAALALVKQNPLYLFMLPLWLLRGIPHLKRQIARLSSLDVTTLPYHVELLEFLKQEHRVHHTLVLVTAADETIAQKVASHLGLFSAVHASDGRINLKGKRKSQLLAQLYGVEGFQYAGNSRADLHIWRQSAAAILVDVPDSLAKQVRRESLRVRHFFGGRRDRWRAFVRALRVHQWAKNLLVFLPVVGAHGFREPARIEESIIAFFAFSFCASAMYVVNDLMDLQADRLHQKKRFRPFASGTLPISDGLLMVPVLLLMAALLALALSPGFSYLLITYVIATMVYSLYLKRVAIADVLTLAGLYTIRILAGGQATRLTISFWLLGFSVFLFLSLAFVKRFAELKSLSILSDSSCEGRDYNVGDSDLLSALGGSSGYLAAMVFALYVNSPEVKVLYTKPQLLWLICPLLIYWISRIWLFAQRGQMNEDPVVFALKDKASYILGVLVALIMAFAV